jgi:two-component system, NarL family, sensor kinase
VRVRHRQLLAWGIFGLTCVLVSAGGWFSAGSGHGRTQPADAVLALAFTAAGALIVSRRSNPLGWLALLMGLSGVAYAADAYTAWSMAHHAAGATWSAWLGLWVWAPAWLALLTVLPLLIPDGRLPSARWRPLLIITWSVIVLFTVTGAFLPASGGSGPANPLAIPGLADPARRGETVMVALLLVLALGCLAAVVTRLRHSTGQVRRQLVWICTGAVIGIAAGFGGAVLPAGWVTPVQSAGALAMPSCLGVAVLRHNLYQVDPVLRRSLTYGLLGCALSLTALGVTTVGAIVLGRDRPVVTVLAAVIIALLVNPAYRLISRGVSRLLYGARGDPYAVLSTLGRRLADTTDPRQVLEALARAAAETVRSPYVVVETVNDLLRVERGTPCAVAVNIPLAFQGTTLGWLRLAPRSPGEVFDPHDRRLLEDTSAHAAAAVCAAVTELDLRAARERLVTTREEERRQLRRDLHDGVGPLLAGLSFTAAAAAGALPADPPRSPSSG